MAVHEEPEDQALLERLRTSADDALIDVAWAAGRAMSMANAVALAVGG
jgi:hypothetical protein